MKWQAWLAVFVLITACQATAPARQVAVQPPELFYHIFIRSFADSDGDRQGDLRGLRDRLDYLQDIGVTAILLTPLYPSQFYHNYFADSFEGIDSAFGAVPDLARLVHDVHARGMKIFLDQEIQYVSGLHAWRRQSEGNPLGPFGRFLLYHDAGNQQPVATLFGTNDFHVWPDQHQEIFTVNLATPGVRAYFSRYLGSWLDPDGDGDPRDGVDGFRIDHMMDDLDNAGVLTGLLEQFWAPLLQELRAINPDIRIIAEQADWGDGEEFLTRGKVDTVFAFPIWSAARDLDAAGFAAAIERANRVVTAGRDQLVFIENHDTERFASAARGQPEILRLGAAITLLTGWTPSLYYGQEIGMSGTRTSDYEAVGDRPVNVDARDIPLRQAFRWVADPLGRGNAAWYMQFPDAYHTPDSNVAGDGVSVAEQVRDQGSLLACYRTLAALRVRHPALAHGATRVIAREGSLVLIGRRTGTEEALVLFNFDPAPQTAVLALPAGAARLYGKAEAVHEGATARVTAPPYSATVWAPAP